MLWSLFKIILFVAGVAGMAWGAGYLLESEGGVQLTVLGTEYSFGPLQSVIAVIVDCGLAGLEGAGPACGDVEVPEWG